MGLQATLAVSPGRTVVAHAAPPNELCSRASAPRPCLPFALAAPPTRPRRGAGCTPLRKSAPPRRLRSRPRRPHLPSAKAAPPRPRRRAGHACRPRRSPLRPGSAAAPAALPSAQGARTRRHGCAPRPPRRSPSTQATRRPLGRARCCSLAKAGLHDDGREHAALRGELEANRGSSAMRSSVQAP